MKIVINRSYGSFSYPKKFCERYSIDPYDWLLYEGDDYRFHELLIDWIEKNPEDSGSLHVVDIPDNVTDWQVHDYDGLESIICVIDGKIVWL